MAVRQDCPKCGRKGNEGHICSDSEDRTATTIGTVLCGGLGALAGGPIGATAGVVIGSKVWKYFNKLDKSYGDGYVLYRFNCMNPNCKHTWVSGIKE